ncbi:hypothetical protein VNO77_02448 [Canavalia gladiata]|uniref:Uncharacterized protein n=1 Tax=Canavalia gladiata TaxID=3824 RepID=A0AAN9R791_CANGL
MLGFSPPLLGVAESEEELRPGPGWSYSRQGTAADEGIAASTEDAEGRDGWLAGSSREEISGFGLTTNLQAASLRYSNGWEALLSPCSIWFLWVRLGDVHKVRVPPQSYPGATSAAIFDIFRDVVACLIKSPVYPALYGYLKDHSTLHAG